jgi:hypothetical protein
MSNLREELKNILRQQPFIEEAVHEDLINLSSLARKLKPDLEKRLNKRLSEGSIIMAIRRMDPGLQLQLQIRFRKFISQLGDIIVRSNLVDITFQNTSSLVDCEHSFIQKLKDLPNGFYSFSRGVDETTIIISAHLEDVLLQCFESEKKISHLKNLSSITLKMPASNTETLGLYYYFFKNLSEGGVNVIEVISTTNEATFVVGQSDVDRAFFILNGLKY